VVGAGNVEVTKLCVVEEYETVWQLVSVIDGTITNTTAAEHPNEQSAWTQHIDNIKRARRSQEEGDDKSAAPLLKPAGPCGPIESHEHDGNSLQARDTDEDEEQEEYKSPIDVLAASLPPGSMTGAPKKRSCEILQQLEGRPRGVYSGVLGYLDVGGGGDFSVLIRTAWHWGDDVEKDDQQSRPLGEEHVDEAREEETNGTSKSEANSKHVEDNASEIWHVGAGGAVTSQSTDQGEWEEMLTKRAAVLRLFTEPEDEV